MKERITAFGTSVAILCGILAAQWVSFLYHWWLFPGILGLIAGWFLHQKAKIYITDQPVCKAERAVIYAAILCFAGCRSALTRLPLSENHLLNAVKGEPVTFTGTVTGIPKEIAGQLRFQVKAEAPNEGTALIVLYGSEEEYRYGERVEINGELRIPPDTGSFSYKDYLERNGVSVICYNPSIHRLSGNGGDSFRVRIFSFREVLLDRIYTLFRNPENSLMAGIILGDETKIPARVERDFQRTGTAHIIAISGANFTVLCWFLLALVRRILPQWWAPLTMIPFIIFYTILVGESAAVVRAAIMCAFTMGGMCIGRSRNGTNSLFLTAALMGLFDPLLLFDIGFQLSVMATLGILLFTGPFQHALERVLVRIPFLHPEHRLSIRDYLTDGLLISISAQIFTTWISAAAFGELSLISLPANFLIAPFQSWIMLGGFLSLFLSFIFKPLGAAAATLVSPAPMLTIQIVQWLAKFESARHYINLSTRNAWLIMALIVLFQLKWRELTVSLRKHLPEYGLAVLASLTLLVWMAAANKADDRMKVTYTSSSSALQLSIQTPGHRRILVGKGMTNYRLQDVFTTHTLFESPVNAVIADFTDFWMVEEFLESSEARKPDLLYLDRELRRAPLSLKTNGNETLHEGFILYEDGVTLRLAADYMNRQAWLVTLGEHSFLFPCGVVPERIFDIRKITPNQAAVVFLGKQDDMQKWHTFFDETLCPGRYCDSLPVLQECGGEISFLSDGRKLWIDE